jgi:hypothetical protein
MLRRSQEQHRKGVMTDQDNEYGSLLFRLDRGWAPARFEGHCESWTGSKGTPRVSEFQPGPLALLLGWLPRAATSCVEHEFISA